MARTDHEGVVLLGSGIFGFGLGALLDVVVFHMILQWHHLLSDFYEPGTLDGLRTNIYFDGIFSLVMVAILLVGAGMVWRGLDRSTESHSSVRALGAVLVGAGLFNVFDGLVDHYVLGFHDVVHGTQAFNPHWVGGGLLVLGMGVLLLFR